MVEVGKVLNNLACVSLMVGDVLRARALVDESLATFRMTGSLPGIGLAANTSGRVAVYEGDFVRATDLLRESLRGAVERGDERSIAVCFRTLAIVVAAEGNAALALRFLAVDHAWREAHAMEIPGDERAEYGQTLTAARSTLGAATSAAVWAEGRQLSLAAAVALVLDESLLSSSSTTDAPSTG